VVRMMVVVGDGSCTPVAVTAQILGALLGLFFGGITPVFLATVVVGGGGCDLDIFPGILTIAIPGGCIGCLFGILITSFGILVASGASTRGEMQPDSDATALVGMERRQSPRRRDNRRQEGQLLDSRFAEK
jgi:hypothetical protein